MRRTTVLLAVFTLVLIADGGARTAAAAPMEAWAHKAAEKVARALSLIAKEERLHPKAADAKKHIFDKFKELPMDLALDPVRACVKESDFELQRLKTCLRAKYEPER
jgi:hypothetical protein